MIRVVRPTPIPSKLLKEGAIEDAQNRNSLDQDRNYKVDILNKIYGHTSVKSVLRAAQYGKCCFCEKDQTEEDGAVEHFRPKNGYKQNRRDKLKKPGYYWLGYTWSNLLFCCKKCNGAKCKGNLFPLRDDASRALDHHADIALEDPYLIDPASVDPNEHLFFEENLINFKTDYGRETIAILRLDRPELNDMREEHLLHIKRGIMLYLIDGGEITAAEKEEVRLFLIDAQLPMAKFSAAAKALIMKSKINLQ